MVILEVAANSNGASVEEGFSTLTDDEEEEEEDEMDIFQSCKLLSDSGNSRRVQATVS